MNIDPVPVCYVILDTQRATHHNFTVLTFPDVIYPPQQLLAF